MAKPSLPQGTRDFGPDIVRKRNFIFNTIRTVFELYGFQPLETPAMENLDTLMGKYGDEGNKLIFKILNNGLDNAAKKEKAREEFEKILEGKNTEGITERALKYDLTIPFARFVAMNHQQLSFPFKRYQIQPVWRADRPAKGRYREFYQCDADVVGSNSLLNEAELICIYDEVFSRLGFKKEEILLKINNRKIWQSIAEYCGCSDKIIDLTTAIDKYEKIGKNGVVNELILRGFNEEAITRILACLFPVVPSEFNWDGVRDDFNLDENTINIWMKIEQKFKTAFDILYCVGFALKEGNVSYQGFLEIIEVFERLLNQDLNLKIEYDSTLARGLNYYTGSIIEIKATGVQMGSIGGGGRYDDLTGLFGVPNIPGVGISFGVDRIYDVMEELKLFPADIYIGTQVLFFNLGDTESKTAFGLMQQLRERGIRCELYHEQSKFDKQFKYAEKKNIPYVIIIGEKEVKDNTFNIKTLASGEQQNLPVTSLLDYRF